MGFFPSHSFQTVNVCFPDIPHFHIFTLQNTYSSKSVCSEWLRSDTKGCSYPSDYIPLHSHFPSRNCLKCTGFVAFCDKHMKSLSPNLPTLTPQHTAAADWVQQARKGKKSQGRPIKWFDEGYRHTSRIWPSMVLWAYSLRDVAPFLTQEVDQRCIKKRTNC